MRRAIILLTAFFLLSIALIPPTFAQEGNTVTVVSLGANIRSGPSTSTTILGSVPAHAVLPVTGQSGTGWWRVESAYGTGWISNRVAAFRGDINSVPVVTEPSGVFVPDIVTVVAANGPAKVYSTPNYSSFVTTIIPTGGSATVIGQTEDGNWYQVIAAGGSGFVNVGTVVHRGDLSSIPFVGDPGPTFRGPTVQLNTTQNVVNDAGQIIGQLPAGATLPIIGRNADNTKWMVIPDGVGIGWINVANVSIAGSAEGVPLRGAEGVAGPAFDSAAHATLTIISDRKLLYNTNAYSVVMLDARRGEEIGIIGRSPDGLWLKTIIRSNVVWAVFSGITFNGDMAALPITDDTPQPDNHIIANAYKLNVRSGPGPEYTILAVVDGGTKLTTTGVSADRVWWRVEGDFGVGWVRTRYILFRGDVSMIPVVSEPLGEIASAIAVSQYATKYYADPNAVTELGTLPSNGEYEITGVNSEWTMFQIDTPYGRVWVKRAHVYFRGFYEVVPVIG
ncbi:MAG: SH3 domain-containing protein [Anaerolineales bacterium]|nr:SH3 domain-containing protein [Anaerolineales bacterium]